MLEIKLTFDCTQSLIDAVSMLRYSADPKATPVDPTPCEVPDDTIEDLIVNTKPKTFTHWTKNQIDALIKNRYEPWDVLIERVGRTQSSIQRKAWGIWGNGWREK